MTKLQQERDQAKASAGRQGLGPPSQDLRYDLGQAGQGLSKQRPDRQFHPEGRLQAADSKRLERKGNLLWYHRRCHVIE